MKRISSNRKGDKDLKVRFNLKQVCDEEKLTQIMLVITINKIRIRVYTKLRIEPKYWSNEAYRCCQIGRMDLRERMRLKQVNEQIDNLVMSLYEMDEVLATQGEYLSTAIVQQIVNKNQPETPSLQNPLICLKK